MDRLEGPEESKRRLRVILQTLSGECSVAQACEVLEVSEARFHELRRLALQGAVAGLMPGRAGRPRTTPPPEGPSRLEELTEENRDLRMQLWAAEIREEIALTMPHLLRPRKKNGAKKSKPTQRRPRRRSRSRS